MSEEPAGGGTGDALPYPVEPWAVRERELDVDRLATTESVFALANGHIGLRATLDEGEPQAQPGTYLSSFYESRTLPYAEGGYGYPEDGQSVVNVTNGSLFRVLIEDEPLDVRYGELHHHERVLDLRAGVLQRELEWESPTGQNVKVATTRLVSFDHRSLVAIRHQVTAVDTPLRVIVQSELVANEPVPTKTKDPRAAAAMEAPLVCEEHDANRTGAHLVHVTKSSKLRMAAAMDHAIDGPDHCEVSSESHTDWARTTVACQLEAGESLTLTKYVAYGWSSRRTRPSLRDQVAAAVSGAMLEGWDAIVAEQRAYLDDFWESADVEVEGDDEIQQAVRFALFHVLQAGARTERRPIAAKGLTGTGYDGHAFWDTEMFVLPVLSYVHPGSAADALRWRHSTLDLARERADTLGLGGATFAWRTIRGQECSAYWPAGTAAYHVNSGVAAAMMRYVSAAGDEDFERDVATEVLVETARLWMSLGHHDRAGQFRLPGVTGPDEYSALGDDNLYTNLMAQQNLRGAADAAERHHEVASGLGVDEAEIAAWETAAARMYVAYNEHLEVHEQSLGFTDLGAWHFEEPRHRHYPLLLNEPYGELYRRQVVKQADLVMALHWRGDAFTREEKARAFEYYEAITVRDSSLSACTQAVIAAEVGHLELAHEYLREAALMDLHDLAHNTADGLHIASLAGAWLALVAGFGGLRDHGGELSFAPALPHGLTKLTFSVLWRGSRLRVSTDGEQTTYDVPEGGATVPLRHFGRAVEVAPGQSATLDNEQVEPLTQVPTQPPGREPGHVGREK